MLGHEQVTGVNGVEGAEIKSDVHSAGGKREILCFRGDGYLNFVCVFFTDAQVISCNPDSHRVAERGNHLHAHRLARNAAHLQERKPEFGVLVVGQNNGLRSGTQLRKAQRASRNILFHSGKDRPGKGRLFIPNFAPCFSFPFLLMAARFYDVETNSRLRQRRKLSSFLDALITSYRPEVQQIDITYLFRTDEALLQVNRDFLQHDTYTDIITFDLSEDEEELESEIHISVERVAENAKDFGTDYDTELHRVLFHGALHLAGLKDKTDEEAQQMRAAEDAALKAYFNPNTQ